jgi:uncharacterized protein
LKKIALIAFAKTLDSKPKSRLAADIGRQRADELYTLLVRTTDFAMTNARLLAERNLCELKTFWALTGTGEKEIFSGHLIFDQGGGTLGSRLFHICRQALASDFAPDQLILIGTDWPSISAECLLEAITTSGACLGPARDGGFYLLSLPKNICAHMSEDFWNSIPFSAENTTEVLVQKINCAFNFLDMSSDLDELTDLQKCIEETQIVLTATLDRMQHQAQLLEKMRDLQMDFPISNL